MFYRLGKISEKPQGGLAAIPLVRPRVEPQRIETTVVSTENGLQGTFFVLFLQLDQFVVIDMMLAFTLDGLANSHPIRVPVNHPDEINEIFDYISYNKVTTTVIFGCYLNLSLLVLEVYLTINPNFTQIQLLIFAQCDSHLSVNFDEEVWLGQESVNFIYFYLFFVIKGFFITSHYVDPISQNGFARSLLYY